MAMRSKVNFKCPECNANVEAEQWTAVNGEKNPQQKLKILEGTLFKAKCPKCGKETKIGYPLLYNDTKQGYMIWLVYDDESVKNTINYFKSSKNDIVDDENGEEVDENCRRRIVMSPESLREKIMIFDSGLDDKMIEILKLAYAKEAQRTLRDDNIAAAFFSNRNGEKHIEMYTEKGKAFVSPVSKKIYEEIEDKYGGKASYAEDRVFIIDDVWALDLLRAMR